MSIAEAFSAFPNLKTQRLILRQIMPDDIDAVFALYSDNSVVEFLDIDTLSARQEAEELVEFFIKRYHNRVSIRWAIALEDKPHKLIGTCGFHPFNEEIMTRLV
ncbi:MAG: GNAT family N-acetyltransferase [Hydrococcus sp. Prado102]|jgi:ribosomal-protein-alanine N-acetyltransferase|nr:GNAT family N-acetyltransferase [Hydrococcus sp. Prado102]